MAVSQETLDEIALSRAEYEAIVDRLGREPEPLELGMFGALWSEHCGYKHSKPLLRTLPSSGERLLVAAGEENAGAVDIGDGRAVVMKIESHNHPSAVEPHQGAATGVGGIVRDIFAMGARPIALLNSLRFGDPARPRNRYLLGGVVGGISAYGNCLGIPNVGGEVAFASCYDGNPLVNAMCVGLIEGRRIISAKAEAPGDLLVLVGADTGRDGIHGASGLASRVFMEEAEMRSAVQVGNPFLEKVLIEACLEVVQLDAVVGMQDCGAAGITSAAVEMAERSDLGLRLDVARVPRREEGMTPYEVMLSESQERMLLAVRPDGADEVSRVFARWELDATVIGEFVEGRDVEIHEGSVRLTATPVQALTEPPLYELDAPRPGWLAELQQADLADLPLPDASPADSLLQMLAAPNIASKHSVYRQYDHQVQTNTVSGPGCDAAVLRLKGTGRGIAFSTDGNSRLCYLDPYTGGAIAVFEACRNVSCSGATPAAITDGLNFGSPEKPNGQYQLSQAVAGIRDACQKLGIPVISGNVSLYNEAAATSIYPTPIIGALGVLDDVRKHATSGFAGDGDVVYLLGAASLHGRVADLAGSEFLYTAHGRVEGMPMLDMDLEASVQAACREAISEGIVRSAHDCSDGGLVIALAESAILGELGFAGECEITGRWDAALFGEAQSRIVVSVAPDNATRLQQVADMHGVPYLRLGTTGGQTFEFPGVLQVSLAEARDAWRHGFERAVTDPSHV